MSIICLGGQPATGKSSIVREWMSDFSWQNNIKLEKTLWGSYCEDCNLYLLGKGYNDSNEMFPGTDRLCYSASKDVKNWINKLKDDNQKVNIIMEGDRVLNKPMINLLFDLNSANNTCFQIQSEACY